MVQQYLISQAISKYHIPIIFTGDGADELFGGFSRMLEYDAQYSDIFDELIHYRLPQIDKMFSAFTLEPRCPYLDFSVLAYALNSDYPDRINKKYLRDSLRLYLPEKIYSHKKQAFKNAPILKNPIKWRNKQRRNKSIA